MKDRRLGICNQPGKGPKQVCVLRVLARPTACRGRTSTNK